MESRIVTQLENTVRCLSQKGGALQSQFQEDLVCNCELGITSRLFDIKRGGVLTTGEETRGLIILSKEDGHWNVNALENTKIQPIPTGNP